MRHLLVQEALVLASEDERHGARRRDGEKVRGAIARGAHVLPIEAFARRGAHDRHAIGDRLLERGELLAILEDIRRMDGQTLAFVPGILQVGGGQAQMPNAHVGHGAAGGTHIARVERADEHHANIVQRIHASAPPCVDFRRLCRGRPPDNPCGRRPPRGGRPCRKDRWRGTSTCRCPSCTSSPKAGRSCIDRP